MTQNITLYDNGLTQGHVINHFNTAILLTTILHFY